MLCIDPKERYLTSKILNHPFIRNVEVLSDMRLPHQEPSLIKANVGRVFKAINSPQTINLAPVNASELARRRANRSKS